MGLGRKLKEAAAAKLRELEAPPTEEELAKLTPAQRERYELFTEQANQVRAGQAVGDPRLLGQVLQGPAGEVVHGVKKAPKAPERITDPAQWESVMEAERAVRDAAREPYLAPSRSPIRISRVATQGGTQGREVADYMASTGLAGRPELVYGLYRVPDRIGTTGGGEKRRLVEWDVVHAATETLAAAETPADVVFEAGRQWVARKPGEPGVLDEDLALAYLVRAGVGPEQTLGIARHCLIEPWHGQDGISHMTTQVSGVHAFHPAALGGTAFNELTGAAPLTLEAGPPEGIWLELLNWDAVARAVHPVSHQRPLLPSPFPYLPLTPQELLRSYLDIVGISPADSYGAQVTHDRPVDLLSRTSAGTWISVRRTTGGDKLPCADGEEHVRMHGGAHIVIAYRDSPAYAEGRQRFAAYQAEVLKTDLGREIHPRSPVPKPDSRTERMLDRAHKVIEFFDTEFFTDDDPVPPRYCWPPV